MAPSFIHSFIRSLAFAAHVSLAASHRRHAPEISESRWLGVPMMADDSKHSPMLMRGASASSQLLAAAPSYPAPATPTASSLASSPPSAADDGSSGSGGSSSRIAERYSSCAGFNASGMLGAIKLPAAPRVPKDIDLTFTEEDSPEYVLLLAPRTTRCVCTGLRTCSWR